MFWCKLGKTTSLPSFVLQLPQTTGSNEESPGHLRTSSCCSVEALEPIRGVSPRIWTVPLSGTFRRRRDAFRLPASTEWDFSRKAIRISTRILEVSSYDIFSGNAFHLSTALSSSVVPTKWWLPDSGLWLETWADQLSLLTEEQHCRRRTGQRTGLNVDLFLRGFSMRRPEMMLSTRRSCEQGARHLAG